MADRILYIGSSLTGAFRKWNSERKVRNADHVVGHGAMWVGSRIRRSDVFRRAGSSIVFDRTFDIGVRAPQVLNVISDLPSAPGAEVAVDLDDYRAIVFTVPILFRVESLRLWRGGHFLSSAGSPDRSERHLAHPISDRALLAVHRAEFVNAYTFLEHLRAVRPEVPLYVTPSILPRPDQPKYPLQWRRRHAAEIAAVQDQMSAEFGAIVVRQPESTIGDGWTTRPGFAADDVHHFTVAFVRALAEETAFGAITDVEDVEGPVAA